MVGDLNEQQMEALLRSQVIAHLGCHAEGTTYVVPIGYVYEGESIIAYSSEGMKLEMMRQNPNVCIQVDQITNLGHWQSVIIWGNFEELYGEEAETALHRFSERMTAAQGSAAHSGSQSSPAQWTYAAGRAATVYRIHIAQKTGRYENR